eukprot:SAG31_NODE_2737_length_5157_cov_7.756869_1_plen_126_part_00
MSIPNSNTVRSAGYSLRTRVMNMIKAPPIRTRAHGRVPRRAHTPVRVSINISSTKFKFTAVLQPVVPTVGTGKEFHTKFKKFSTRTARSTAVYIRYSCLTKFSSIIDLARPGGTLKIGLFLHTPW